MNPPPMGITERLANLSVGWVLVIVAILTVMRFVLIRQQHPIAKQIAELAESLAIAMALVFLLIRPFIMQAFFIPSESMLPGLQVGDHLMVNKFVYRFGDPKQGDVIVFKAWEATAAATDGVRRDYIKRVIGTPGDLVRVRGGYITVGKMRFENRMMIRSQLQQFRTLGGFGMVKLLPNAVYVDNRLLNKSEIALALTGDPHQKVSVVPGVVYVNDKKLVEPYLAEDPWQDYPIASLEMQRRYGVPITPTDIVITDKKGVRWVKVPQDTYLVMGDNRNNSSDGRFWGPLDRADILGKAMFRFFPLGRISGVH